jgi:sugar-specific transcriptional regulator TrmB
MAEGKELQKEEIMQLLRKFDLTDYESRAYCALLFMGTGTIGEISKESKVPQPKLYAVLDSLMNKQLVEFLGDRPREFKVIPPEIVLRSKLEEKENELKTTREKIEMLVNYLKPSDGKENVFEGVWTVKGSGSKDFMERLARMFDKSHDYVFIISRNFTWSSRLAESIKAANRRDVKIRTIAIKEIDSDNYLRAKWFHTHGVEIRLYKTEVHPIILLADGKEVLIRMDQKPTQTEKVRFVSLWSEDQSLVSVFDFYVKNLWKMAKPVDLKRAAETNRKIETKGI